MWVAGIAWTVDVVYALRYASFMTPTAKTQSEPVTTTTVTYSVEEYLTAADRWVACWHRISNLDEAKTIHARCVAAMTVGDHWRVTKTTTVSTVEVV